MEHITRILEILMLVAFGFSWPNNIIVSIKNKSTKGKSLLFLLFIDFGYVCGILSKLFAEEIVVYVLVFYIINFIMVSTDIVLYFYYRNREKKM